jgi:hypothetical protein
MNLSSRMTTTSPIRKMMPTALPRNLNTRLSRKGFGGECGFSGIPTVG